MTLRYAFYSLLLSRYNSGVVGELNGCKPPTLLDFLCRPQLFLTQTDSRNSFYSNLTRLNEFRTPPACQMME